MPDNQSLISIIIPCYNYADFIEKAIVSLKQFALNLEIIVIDDGSTDNLAQVVKNYPSVKYFFQENKGLSAARNNGLKRSLGKYIVFLDADDWILEKGLVKSIEVLERDADCAMVVGKYQLTHNRTHLSVPMPEKFNIQDPYLELLRRGYIHKIHAVLFSAEIIKHMSFDEELPSAEDLDFYFKIAKNYKICHHNEAVAVYFMHTRNMTRNIYRTLDMAIHVMEKQRPSLQSTNEELALSDGIAFMTKYFTTVSFNELNKQLVQKTTENILSDVYNLKFRNPKLFYDLKDNHGKILNALLEHDKIELKDSQRQFLLQPEKNPFVRLLRNFFTIVYHKHRIKQLLSIFFPNSKFAVNN